MVEAFASAAASGDLAALIRVLDPDVVLVSDGGGLVTSARRPVIGADRVARFLRGILAKEQPGDVIDRVVVNGALGFAVYQQGQLVTVVSVTAAAGRVTRLDLIRAPGKLPAWPGNSARRGGITTGLRARRRTVARDSSRTRISRVTEKADYSVMLPEFRGVGAGQLVKGVPSGLVLGDQGGTGQLGHQPARRSRCIAKQAGP